MSNFEDGCYAKLIDLNKTKRNPSSQLRSVDEGDAHRERAASSPATAPSRRPIPQHFDLTDGSITENTRFAYPLSTANPGVEGGGQLGPTPSPSCS